MGMTEERLQLALDAGQMGTWSYNLETGEQLWDRRQYGLFGVPQDTLITRDLFMSLVLPEDRGSLELGAAELRPGVRHDSQFRIRRHDGSIRWLTAHSLTRADSAGRAIEVVGVNWDVTDQKDTEGGLERSADQLQLALNAGRMGTWRFDLATGQQEWDARQYELFGVAEGTPPTRELFLSLVEPSDLPQVAFGEDDLRPGHFHDTEFRVRTPDGQTRWLAARSFARHDASGRAIERIGVNWDVTESKSRELHLIQAERRLELATDAAQIGIWDWNVKTGAFFYSARGRAIYGFTPDEEITYDRLRARTHPDDYNKIEPILARALDPKMRSRETYRYRITRADNGEERWLLAHGGAVFSGETAEAETLSYTGTLQDITEDVRLERMLTDEQARLRLALAAGDLAVWEVDIATNTVTSSPELNRLYGLSDASTPTLDDFRTRYAPGEWARVQGEAEANVARGEKSIRFEARHLWPDGTVKWISVRAQLVVDAESVPQRVIGVAMDVTDRRLAEERLLVTARELQHRVKNSLTVVQAIAAQTFRSAKTKEEGVATFSGRLHALAAATELVTRGNWTTVSVRGVVDEITSPYRDDAGARFRIAGDDETVGSTNAVSLGMALHELCTNAIKYGALSVDGGHVEINWRTKDGVLTLTWQEVNGPPVSVIGTKGFGTRLLTSGLFDPGVGKVELEFRPTGVFCRLMIGPSAEHGVGPFGSP